MHLTIKETQMHTRIKRTFLIDQNLFFKLKSYVAQQRIHSYSIVLETLIEQYLKNPTLINELVKSPKSKKAVEAVVVDNEEHSNI